MSQVVILAGETSLTDICGTPLLGRQLQMIARSACRDVLVRTGDDRIAAYCGDGRSWGLKLRLAAGDLLAPTFCVLHGDTMLDVDLDRMLAAHRRAKADATLLLRPTGDPPGSELVELDESGRVRRFLPPPQPPGVDRHNMTRTGLYVLERDVASDFGGDILSALLAKGRVLHGYRSPEYVEAADTADRLANIRRDVENGRVMHLSLRRPVPAVFLDRDGVLNVERDRITQPDQLALMPDALEALARLNRSDYRTVVVTNQAVVARGLSTPTELAQIHARLETLLGAGGTYVDRIYHCPHHPEFGGACDCRKPAPGMVRQAARELNLDVANSWMVGDASTDMGLARNCGMGGILVRSGHGGRDGKSPAVPHFVLNDMGDAVDFILTRWPRLEAMLAGLAAEIQAGQIVLIGGAARAGKTSLAQALSLHLARRGRASCVVSLDSWLHPVDRRGPGILGRFDLALAEADIAELVAHRRPLVPPHYDTITRTRQPGRLTVEPGVDGIIIVEGVPALVNDRLLALADHLWFVQGEEAARRTRFIAEYRGRGWDDAAVERTYNARLLDELPLVADSARHADRLISTDGLL